MPSSLTSLPAIAGLLRFVVWDIQGAHAHGSQQLQGKREAESAGVDPVDEYLCVDGHAVALQPTCKVLVGDVLLLPDFFDEVFRSTLVVVARFLVGHKWFSIYTNTFEPHFYLKYMDFDVFSKVAVSRSYTHWSRKFRGNQT